MKRDPGNAANRADVVVVGGGLAGLMAAAVAARAGRRVLVLEKSRHLGGRAATTLHGDVRFNLGPHALFCEGHAFRLLRELGVSFKGSVPKPGRGLFLFGGRKFVAPQGVMSLVSSTLFSLREKSQLACLPRTLAAVDCRAADRVSVADWVNRFTTGEQLRSVVHVFLRLSTYGDDPAHQSAGAALEQLQLALRGNVWYLDGGWQAIVDGLHATAAVMGAEVRRSAPVARIASEADAVKVELADGSHLLAKAAIIAAAPRTAAEMLHLPVSHPLAQWSAAARPALAASLDVAVDRLANPRERFALGLDQPTYYSVHSAAADLAPAGIAVIHVMQYLGSESPEDVSRVEANLEAVLDLIQPGWRTHVVARRFLPNLVACSAISAASTAGNAGRPRAAVPGHPRIFLAGDWVGEQGQLADAVAASAERAARLAVQVTSAAATCLECCR